MKHLNIVLIVLSVALVNSLYAKGQGIEFTDELWQKSIGVAQKENKAIFVYAYSPHCHFCKEMEQKVFQERPVGDFYNSTFINYKINLEESEGRKWAEEYGIKGFPTYLFFNKNGEIIHQSGGAKSADEFILDGKNAFDKENSFYSLKRRYDRGDRSSSLLYNYSIALANSNFDNSNYNAVVEEYLRSLHEEEFLLEKNLKFIFNIHLDYSTLATQFFLNNHSAFHPLFSNEQITKKMERIFIRAARKAGVKNDSSMFDKLNQTIMEKDFSNHDKLSALVHMNFYAGQENWKAYANAAIDYSDIASSSGDWQTLMEAAVYLKHFAIEKDLLNKAVQIIKVAIKVEENYENLFLYAQLLHKMGEFDTALKFANQALRVSEDSERKKEAITLIEMIKTN